MAGGCVKCIRYLVFVFNFIFWLLGLGILGFGIYLRVDPSFASVIGAMPSQDLYIFAYLLIGIGAVMTVVGFLGCCGAYQESTCLLATFFACLLVIFAVQVAAGVVGYLKRDDMNAYWNTTLNNFVITYDYANSSAQTTAMNSIQMGFNCCGANGPNDYLNTDWTRKQPGYYPPSCCLASSAVLISISTSGNTLNANVNIGTTSAPASKKGCLYTNANNFKDGCIAKSCGSLANYWWILLAFGGTILLVELLGMIFGITLCCSVRRRNDAYDGYDQPESQNLVS